MKSVLYFFCFNLTCFGFSFPFKKDTLSHAPEIKKIRVGFFPNITHPHALVAQALAREGKDWFVSYLPSNHKVEWYRFNAGPTAMESLVTHTIDVSYVGPNPALNTYLRSKGKEVRLLSGAIRGGAGLVVQKDLATKPLKEWNGKKIASPQYGNTQDVACRNWVQNQQKNAIKLMILPATNPDQLMLFKKKQIDGAWTIEPWRSRLISEGEGILYLDDKESWTTILVASNDFCAHSSELTKAFVQAHHALNQWIQEHFEEAARLIQSELKHQMGVFFDKEFILQALKNLHFDIHPKQQDFEKLIDDAITTSLLKKELKLPLDLFFQEITKNETISSKQ